MRRTLIFEVALPDYYLDDWDEVMTFYDGDASTLEMVSNESGLCDARVKLVLLVGGKDSTFAEWVNGVIVAARVVARKPEHDPPRDSRLDEILGERAVS